MICYVLSGVVFSVVVCCAFFTGWHTLWLFGPTVFCQKIVPIFVCRFALFRGSLQP